DPAQRDRLRRRPRRDRPYGHRPHGAVPVRREPRSHATRAPGRRHTERGVVGGIEVLPFGFLIFVVGSLVIANAWAVIDARMAADAAARQAARAYVESPNCT